jgi:hypothetical protein
MTIISLLCTFMLSPYFTFYLESREIIHHGLHGFHGKEFTDMLTDKDDFTEFKRINLRYSIVNLSL